jgi:uncharacterized protein
VNVQDIIDALSLFPATCGYMSTAYAGDHGAALYFLITPERPGALHALDADQIYHYYAGAPLQVLFLTGGGSTVQTLGSFAPGSRGQLMVPAGTVHASRTTGEYTLACTTSFFTQRPLASPPHHDQVRAAAALGFTRAMPVGSPNEPDEPRQ